MATSSGPSGTASTLGTAPDQDHEGLLRFVERFALMLSSTGFPRMPARVFAYVLAEDAEKYTAADLASGLRVSQGAISGAVRHLVQVGLLAREREPGSRSDHYRIFDSDVWGTIVRQQMPLVDLFEQAAAEGAELLAPDSLGARRMRETQEFYAFYREMLCELLDRWSEHRRAHGLVSGTP